jgi:hypothetical protein
VVDFNPFDMDLDGDVDGIDFLGFDYLVRRVLRSDEDEQSDDEPNPLCGGEECHDHCESHC